MKNTKKILTDKDIDRMADAPTPVMDAALRRKIVTELGIKRRMDVRAAADMAPNDPGSRRIYTEGGVLTLDLHNRTEDQAWGAIGALFRQNPGRRVRVITGASGILKIKFQDWITNGTLAPYVTEWGMVNRGCYVVKVKKKLEI